MFLFSLFLFRLSDVPPIRFPLPMNPLQLVLYCRGFGAYEVGSASRVSMWQCLRVKCGRTVLLRLCRIALWVLVAHFVGLVSLVLMSLIISWRVAPLPYPSLSLITRAAPCTIL